MAKQPSVYHTIIPYLTVSDPAAAIDFYRSVFGAEPEDQFHGNRTAKIADPSGHLWVVGALLDELPDAEITRRFKDMMGG